MKTRFFLIIMAFLAISCSKNDTAVTDQKTGRTGTSSELPAPGDPGQIAGQIAGQEAEQASGQFPAEDRQTDPGAGSSAFAPDFADSEPGAAESAQAAVLRKVGEIVFTQGEVSVQRAGKGLAKIDIGDVVNRYDVLITGPGSRAEIDLAAGRPGGASIKLAENTVFYFDTRELSESTRKTVVQLLAGSIAVKVDRLATGSFDVATESNVMGVRGTVFYADASLDGSTLLSCFEGKVSVSSGSEAALAMPGQVVSQKSGFGLERTEPGIGSISRYREDWNEKAFESFKAEALALTYRYATVLDSRKASFLTAWASLRAQSAILDTWRKARADGRTPRFTDWREEKKTIAGLLFSCLEGLFIMEQPYYKLLAIKSWHEQGIGTGTLRDGTNSTSFFTSFESRYNEIVMAMSGVREAMELFVWASAGSPLGEFFGSKAENLGTGQLLLGDDDWNF